MAYSKSFCLKTDLNFSRMKHGRAALNFFNTNISPILASTLLYSDSHSSLQDKRNNEKRVYVHVFGVRHKNSMVAGESIIIIMYLI